jgi:hypothetical protein
MPIDPNADTVIQQLFSDNSTISSQNTSMNDPDKAGPSTRAKGKRNLKADASK